MIKLGVIFGGESVEHEISIISALQAIESIDTNKYEIYPIYISKKGIWYYDKTLIDINLFKNMEFLNKLNPIHLVNEKNSVVIKSTKSKLFSSAVITTIDMVLPIVHGTNVEDGKLQGYLETINCKYAGPDVYSAVVGQDKSYMRDIFFTNKVNQVKYCWVTDNMDVDAIDKKIKETTKYPVIVKPALLGSSVGIEVIKNKKELEAKIDMCFSYCYKLLIEEFIGEFREMNIAVLGNYKNFKLSKIEEVAKSDDILSFDDKYTSGSKKSSGMASLDRIIPAKITKALEAKIIEEASKAFVSLNAQGIVRIDLMIFNDKVHVNEINNIPGSMSFYLWDSYPELLNNVIDLGVEKYFDKKNKNFSFETNVLELSSKGSKK